MTFAFRTFVDYHHKIICNSNWFDIGLPPSDGSHVSISGVYPVTKLNICTSQSFSAVGPVGTSFDSILFLNW